MTKKMVLLAAIALLVPSFAMAELVTFSTTGTFSNPSLFPSLTFTGVTNESSKGGGNLSFGSFDLAPCTSTCKGSEKFDLHIVESSPGSGSGDIVVNLVGTVTGVGSGLNLTFKKAVVTIGTGTSAVTYSLPFQESINFNATTTLNGKVVAVAPEPNARFLLGLGTVGLLGLALISRKMIAN